MTRPYGRSSQDRLCAESYRWTYTALSVTVILKRYNRNMTELILTTFDWVPELPRGYVRDLRVRWALEEAGLPYRVEGVSFSDRYADHFAH
jgi:hypothetical protein